MQRKWTYLLAALGCLAGMVAGNAWAASSAFCEPGLLQGNPICILLLLFGIGVGSISLAAVGAGVGWLIDGGPKTSAEVEPAAGFTPGAATRAGARYGLLITITSYFLVWLTGGLEGLNRLKQHGWDWLFVLPIVIGVAVGYFIDRREKGD
jgi:hypothetical protein